MIASLSMIVLNSTKKRGVPHFRVSTTCLTIHLTRKNQPDTLVTLDNNVPSLNYVKILTVQSIENFKNF